MASVDVVMPKMGESVIEGTVLTWHKNIGEPVDLDETLLEIGTDKVDTDIPSPVSGRLAEILVEEGATVEVGTILARISTDTIDVQDPVQPESDPESGVPAVAATLPEAASSSAPPASVIDIVMPKMGESVIEGTVISWGKKPGDEVDLDETVLEIGTDKVDSEIPAPASGILLEILVAEGETVEVGTVLGRIGEPGGAVQALSSSAPQVAAATEEMAGTPEGPVSPGDGAPKRRGSDGRFFSPLVRSIAAEEGVSQAELETIQGTGKESRVTKKDILAFLKNRAAAPKSVTKPQKPVVASKTPVAPTTIRSGERVQVVPMDRMRQIIAEHMVRSKSTSAHVTSFAEADVTNLVRLRELQKNSFFEREGVKLTYTPFFVRAAVDALRAHPYLNSSVEGTNIILKKDFHVGIAVAVGQMGLVVPVIRDAGGKNLVGLAKAAADLADKARSKRLEPDDLSGGTFTVTNVGSLGSIIGTPIINQPQVAILATGTIRKQPVVIEDPSLGDVIAIRNIMMLSLTYDHRIIDGAMAASFMQAVVSGLEDVDPNDDVLV